VIARALMPGIGALMAPPGRSLLRQAATWRILFAYAIGFGLVSGAYEVALAVAMPELPGVPWQASFRIIHSLIWALAVALALAIAERWPVKSPTRQWGRVLAQVAVGLVIGPIWGLIAYAFSGWFMPWRRAGGLWGIIATDAKGALFAYGTAAIVVHVVLRAREQRERAVAFVEAKTRLAEARVQIVTLGMQSEGVLAALDAIVELVPRDPKAANEAIVLLADVLGQFVEITRAGSATLGEELALASAHARLLGTQGASAQVRWDAAAEVLAREVPHLAVWPVLERAVHRAQGTGDGMVHVRAELGEGDRLTIVVTELGRDGEPLLQDDLLGGDGSELPAHTSAADVRVTRRASPMGPETVIEVHGHRGLPASAPQTVTAATAAPIPRRPAHA
jgi:hypothetical protein